MLDVTITGLQIARKRKETPRGHTILAYFTAIVGPFTLIGCSFVRTAKNGLAVWLPNLDDKRSAQMRKVEMSDDETRNAILTKARETYQMMGGTDAEYRRSDGTPRRPGPIYPQTPDLIEGSDAPATIEVARKRITSFAELRKMGEATE